MQGIGVIKANIEVGSQRMFLGISRRSVSPSGIIPQIQVQAEYQRSLRSTADTLGEHRQRFHGHFKPLEASSIRLDPPVWSDVFSTMQDISERATTLRKTLFKEDDSILEAERARITLKRLHLGQRDFSPSALATLDAVGKKEDQYTRSQAALLTLMRVDKNVLLSEESSSERESTLVSVNKLAFNTNKAYRDLQSRLSLLQFQTRTRNISSENEGRRAPVKVIDEIAHYKKYLSFLRQPTIVLTNRREVLASHNLQNEYDRLRFMGVQPADLHHFGRFLGVHSKRDGKLGIMPFSRMETMLLYKDIVKVAGEEFERHLASVSSVDAAYNALAIRVNAQKKLAKLQQEVEGFIQTRAQLYPATS